jgi:hypothetical protein
MPWFSLAAMLLATAAPAGPERYVPGGWASEEQGEFYEQWFGSQLRAMGEPVLSAPGSLDGFRRRFRMLVLPSFHHAYSVRVDERRDGRVEVRAVRLDGKGGYAPGKILEQESYATDRRAVEPLYRAVERAQLASLAREGPSVSPDGSLIVCADGVRFVFELVDRSGSRFVTQGCGASNRIWGLVDAADALRRSVGSDLDKYR